MAAKRCASCGELIHPRPQVPDQVFCSSRECQRARKRLWQQAKLREDADYRENQRAAQRGWQARNPDYWRRYRSRKMPGTDGVRHAKMDSSIGLSAGLYRIRKSGVSSKKSGELWIIEPFPSALKVRARWTCQERT